MRLFSCAVGVCAANIDSDAGRGAGWTNFGPARTVCCEVAAERTGAVAVD